MPFYSEMAMSKEHYRYTIRDTRTGEKLGSMLSKEGFFNVTPEMIRNAFFIFKSSDLRIVRVKWMDYDEVEIHVDITARELPPQLTVWKNRDGERIKTTDSHQKIDKPILREMFPDCNHKSLRITHVDLGEEDEVRIWVKARKK